MSYFDEDDYDDDFDPFDYDDDDVEWDDDDDSGWSPLDPPQSTPIEDLRPDRHTGVICPVDGPQGLSKAEYDRQMSNPNAKWTCPVCGGLAKWDDDRYEAAIDISDRGPSLD